MKTKFLVIICAYSSTDILTVLCTYLKVAQHSFYMCSAAQDYEKHYGVDTAIILTVLYHFTGLLQANDKENLMTKFSANRQPKPDYR